jgi:CBS domain-containing protein
MKIRDLMTKKVECLGPRATLKRAAQLMNDADVGSIPVVEEGRVIGVLTDRDIVMRTVAEGINPADATVGEVMTPRVIRCGEDDDAEEAARIMAAHHVRRVVVTDDGGGLAGIVALADLAAAALAEDDAVEAPVASLVAGELAAVRTYREALEKMGAGPAAGELRRIESDHEDAVRLLRERLSDPDAGAGAPRLWRAFADAVERGAALRFGETAVLKALKSGEELEIRDYHQALNDERLSPELKDVICDTLLPRTWSHVSALERCLHPEPFA